MLEGSTWCKGNEQKGKESFQLRVSQSRFEKHKEKLRRRDKKHMTTENN